MGKLPNSTVADLLGIQPFGPTGIVNGNNLSAVGQGLKKLFKPQMEYSRTFSDEDAPSLSQKRGGNSGLLPFIVPTCQDIELNSAGGDEGYDEEFELQKQNNEYEFTVVFSAFFVPDRLILSADGEGIYDSGCIGTQIGQPSSVTETVLMPAGAQKLRVQVDPNCAGPTTGTAWTLLLSGICAKSIE